MSIPAPVKSDEKLFYVVNNMGSDGGVIFHFHPQKSNNVCAVVAQLSKMVNMMRTCNHISHIDLMSYETSAIHTTYNAMDKEAEQDAIITETPSLEHTKKFIPPSQDVSAPQNKQMVSTVPEIIFPENRT